jgi:hypothetical protein
VFARIKKSTKLGLKVRDDSFCIFIFYGKQVKSRVLKEWAELVASQLTQLTKDANRIK